MERILISACLMGQPVRYHGGHSLVHHPSLEMWQRQGRLILLCPEVAVGLNTPRARSEISESAGGLAVLQRRARVLDESGLDVTLIYRRAAEHAVSVAKSNRARVAILKDGSPSCGTTFTYDGSFSGRRTTEAGVVAAALTALGVACYAAEQLEQAAEYIAALDAHLTNPRPLI